ncbi:MAG: hypothetical protein JWN84_1781 [Nocardioides sp.]|nr:hypothetical protein [Nocardioides sp.]
MKRTTVSVVSAGTLGLAGLVATGLLALPGAATSNAAGDDRFLKRDDDTPDIVLVADDDDDDTNDNTNTGTNSRSRNDGTGTGAATGRDDSRDRGQRDFTTDGPGSGNRDFSARQTNDRSRNNTRR